MDNEKCRYRVIEDAKGNFYGYYYYTEDHIYLRFFDGFVVSIPILENGHICPSVFFRPFGNFFVDKKYKGVYSIYCRDMKGRFVNIVEE